jgi:hypothetical protein
MTIATTVPLSIKILRWIARIWSLILLVIALMIVIIPDPYATEPVPAVDWLLLGLWGTAVLGLLVAWRWELAGGIITLASMLLRELVWVLVNKAWIVNLLIVWVLIVPPALMFLAVWRMQRRTS